ncbi:MAG: Mini-ribonuclease 3 [Thermovenabulum sp.]|uniref:Mini-ribonuclease 3 n=1 Tax=Thermovenabulum sp. TaxID=3100335 RepID=UPI003C7DE3AD
MEDISSLALAFVGDAVFNLFIRTMVIKTKKKVRDLHVESIKYVKASAQAEILKKLEAFLTPEEKEVVRKARNAKVNTVPKNATLADYHMSTGFEALLGYLYLSGQNDRLNKILLASYEVIKNSSEKESGRS